MKNPKKVHSPINNIKNTEYRLKATVEKSDGTKLSMYASDNGLILILVLFLIWLLNKLMKKTESGSTPSVSSTNSSRPINYTYTYIPNS